MRSTVKPTRRSFLSVPTIGALLLLLTLSSHAARLQWPDEPFTVTAQGKPVGELLGELCAAYEFAPHISDLVNRDTISGTFNNWDPGEFFRTMVKSYGLIWYFDPNGRDLYIYKSSEQQTRVISADGIDQFRLKKALINLEIWDSRFDLSSADQEGLFRVSGPARFVSLVQETTDKLAVHKKAVRQTRKKKEQIVKIIPLRFAWADDIIIQGSTGITRIPGVVSVLRSLLYGQQSGSLLSNTFGQTNVNIARPYSFEKMIEKYYNIGTETDPANESSRDSDQLRFTADKRLNAVIVMDYEENLAELEELVYALDIPVCLIEIKASIIDINADQDLDIGFDWTGKAEDSRTSLDVSSRMLPAVSAPPVFSTTLSTAAAVELMGRISALEEKGDADILSRPSVLTLDNSEAAIEYTETFYVRVASTEDAELYTISTGSVLRVTPHIIDNPGAERTIKLAFSIEDGGLSEDNSSVDGIPVTKKSMISSQAIVKKHESLLVGGHVRQIDRKVHAGIPFLSRLPLLGYLFRRTIHKKKNYERYFLLQPSIVRCDMNYVDSHDTSRLLDRFTPERFER